MNTKSFINICNFLQNADKKIKKLENEGGKCSEILEGHDFATTEFPFLNSFPIRHLCILQKNTNNVES